MLIHVKITAHPLLSARSQKTMHVNKRVQIFEWTSFGNPLVFLDAFDLLIVDFLLYRSNDYG